MHLFLACTKQTGPRRPGVIAASGRCGPSSWWSGQMMPTCAWRVPQTYPGAYPRANTSSLLGKGSLMSVRRFRRHSATAVALAGLFLTASGCTGDSNADPDPLPSSSDSNTPSSPTTSATPTPSGWESEFTEEQLAEYQAALGRWEDYERESAPIWADPQPSPETLKFFAS